MTSNVAPISRKLHIIVAARSPDDLRAVEYALAVCIARDEASRRERKIERSYFAVRSFNPEEIRRLSSEYHTQKMRRGELSELFARLRAALSVRDQLIVQNVWKGAAMIPGVSHTIRKG